MPHIKFYDHNWNECTYDKAQNEITWTFGSLPVTTGTTSKDCTTKFTNNINFGGFPFIPKP